MNKKLFIFFLEDKTINYVEISISLLRNQYLPSSLDVSKWIRGRVFDLHSPETKRRKKLLINSTSKWRLNVWIDYRK